MWGHVVGVLCASRVVGASVGRCVAGRSVEVV